MIRRNKYTVVTLVILSLVHRFPSITNALTITKNGNPQAVIILGDDAIPAEKTAANELAANLKAITGATIPIYSDTTSTRIATRIYVGQTACVKRKLPGFDWKTLSRDGIIIKTIPNGLILAGDRPRGSLYAVYTFLESDIGCRWWTPDASYIPKNPTLTIGKKDIKYKPPFYYRDIFAKQVNGENYLFASRLKLNGAFNTIPDEYGSRYKIPGFSLLFSEVLSPSVYFGDHPEWFSMVNGKRIQNGQLCLSNSGMRDEMLKQVLSIIERDPSAGIIDISVDDNEGVCECPNCKELERTTGSRTDAYLQFINSLAIDIDKVYPGYLLKTQAYRHTRKAPVTVKPNKNVIILLTDIDVIVSQTVNAEINSGFYNDFRKWRALSNHLFIWDYTANYRNLLIPHPNIQVFAPNIRLFAKHGVEGVFAQGDGYNKDAAMTALKSWVIAHLLWNPGLDENVLVNAFLDGYYGKAAPYIANYLRIANTAIDRKNFALTNDLWRPVCFDSSDLVAMLKEFDKAEQAVRENLEQLRRVKIQRLAVEHAWLLMRVGVQDDVLRSYPLNGKMVAETFLALSDSSGNSYLGEQNIMNADYRQYIRDIGNEPLTGRTATIPSICQGLSADKWTDIQDSRFILAGWPVWSTEAKDTNASDGYAARMPGNHYMWGTQIPLWVRTGANKEVECYLSVKCQAKLAKGLAFTMGVYDPRTGKSSNVRSVQVEEIHDDLYHDYNLGRLTIKSGMYVWVAPPAAPDRVEAILVDRALLIYR